MNAYYNEFDPFAAAWLRELIAENLIAPGDVDERSIEDVTPGDLSGYTQCHFFAGIGGWSVALRQAGWADSRPVWTGSCPCQPFSAAGKGDGFADERHLWPSFFHLIAQCRPATVFGEQVEAAINHGWLDLVQDDLEGEGYAFGAAGIPAASVGAPHIRQRVWWVAESYGSDRASRPLLYHINTAGNSLASDGGDIGWLADSKRHGLQGTKHSERRQGKAGGGRRFANESCANKRMEHSPSDGRKQRRAESSGRKPAGGCGEVELGFPDSDGRQSWSEAAETAGHRGSAESAGIWRNLEWIACRDGKWRPVKPGIQPMAHGVRNRVGVLRGAGNAIVPQVAAEFVTAYMDLRHG